MDGNAGGYVIKFLQEQQSCWYASLYLDRMGQRCVFFSELNPHARADNDDNEGEDATGAFARTLSRSRLVSRIPYIILGWMSCVGLHSREEEN